MIPDVEAAVVGFLVARPAIVALAGEHAVATELPADAPLPRLRISLAGGRVAVSRWLYAPVVSIEAFAHTKAAAFELLAATVAELETGLSGAQVAQGVVTSVEQAAGVSYMPDPSSEVPRYLTSVTIHIHPN